MRDSLHETVLERLEAENVSGGRSRHAQEGGGADLRRLGADRQALPEAAHRETGDVEPKPLTGPPARKGAALEAALPAQAEANPDLTLAEHCELFEEQRVACASRAPR